MGKTDATRKEKKNNMGASGLFLSLLFTLFFGLVRLWGGEGGILLLYTTGMEIFFCFCFFFLTCNNGFINKCTHILLPTFT